MTMFRCDGCHCVDILEYANEGAVPLKEGEFLCAECRPIKLEDGSVIRGHWHNQFPKTVYDALQHDVVNDNPTGVSH
jgi:recombinational DNA repair protein (RecF pathway)